MKYTENNRGKIQNRERGQQIIDFSGIRYKNITPTDVDGFFERENKIFVFYEFKLPGVEMPSGQRLALMRVVDGLSEAGKAAVLFLCRHNEYDPKTDIKAGSAIVEAVYLNKTWYKGKNLTAKEYTDRFIEWVDLLGNQAKV